MAIKDILVFLRDLSKNNNRDWFQEHKPTYQQLNKEFKQLAERVQTQLNKADNIDKVKVFRIYRDVRFSKDKSPYKNNFGSSFHRQKPELRGGYYIHLQPGESFIAIGFWAPEKEDLLRIRKEFESDDASIRKIISQKKFKDIWDGFVGESLKTAPKGFDKEHLAIDLIRRKQYIFTRQFSDKEVGTEDFDERVARSFVAARPFLDYMSEVLTTDLNGASII